MNTTKEKTTTINGFQDLIHPYAVEEFSKQYWDQKPLLIKREDTSYFQSLLSIDKVDEVLDFHRPKGNSIRVIKNQEPLSPVKYENADGSLNLNQLYASYSDGHTIVVNEIDRFWKPLKKLCSNIAELLQHKTVANMYLTPKNQKALMPHYDTHDVFVVQVEGTKHWKLYDTEYPTPLVNSFQPIFQREQLKNVREITVTAGDIMYIPRGVPHEAITTDESSLHLTIGVYPTQWLDLLQKTLHTVAMSNEELRKALPIGFLNQPSINTPETLKNILNCILDTTNIKGAMQVIEEESRGQKRPLADGHFTHLDHLSTLEVDATLTQREHMNCKVQKLGSAARIIFAGNVIRGPISIAPALEFIATTKSSFQIHEIPSLSEDNKLKLAKRLIRGGLLQVK